LASNSDGAALKGGRRGTSRLQLPDQGVRVAGIKPGPRRKVEKGSGKPRPSAYRPGVSRRQPGSVRQRAQGAEPSEDGQQRGRPGLGGTRRPPSEREDVGEEGQPKLKAFGAVHVRRACGKREGP